MNSASKTLIIFFVSKLAIVYFNTRQNFKIIICIIINACVLVVVLRHIEFKLYRRLGRTSWDSDVLSGFSSYLASSGRLFQIPVCSKFDVK